jgi:acylphosphatase
MAEGRVRAHALVHGRVQGVWFRQSTAELAKTLGVDGWVRNLPDGGVEAVFEGPAAAVADAIAFVGTGPPRAEIASCEVAWEEPTGEAGFRITG